MVRLLKDEDESVRIAASASLSRMKVHPIGVLRDMIAALDDKSASVRWNIGIAIAARGAAAKEAVPVLIESLKTRTGRDREMCAWTLGEIGVEAKDAIPALIGSLKDEHAPARRDLAIAIVKVDSRGSKHAAWPGPASQGSR